MVEEYRARQIEAETERAQDAAYWVARIRIALDAAVDPENAVDLVRLILADHAAVSGRR